MNDAPGHPVFEDSKARTQMEFGNEENSDIKLSMTLGSKIKILEIACVISCTLLAVSCLLDIEDQGLLFPLVSITWGGAFNYRAKLRREKEPNAKIALPLFSRTIGRTLTWVWLLFYLAMSAKMLLFGTIRLLDVEIFKRQGVEIFGYITSKDSNDVGIPSYHLSYHYETEAGENYDQRIKVSQSVWYDLKDGDRVSIRYLPQRPWRSRLDFGNIAHEEVRGALIQGILGIFFFLFGTGIFVYALKKYPKADAPAETSESPPTPSLAQK